MTKILNHIAAVIAGSLVLGAASFVAAPSTAEAASCWYHNGSLMRLTANGARRTFTYVQPRAVLRRAGVRRGTVLFTGRKSGNRYVGTARRFSKFCPGNPLKYSVSGPVSASQTRVTVSGSRPVHKACRPTGRNAWDTLVFTYSHRC